MLAALLSLHLVAPPPPRFDRLSLALVPCLSGADTRRAALGFLAQASPPELALRAQLDVLNRRISALRTDWPVGSLALVYAGFGLASALLLPGLMLALMSPLLGGLAPLLAIGLVLLGAGVVGLVVGSSSAAAARLEREELVRQRAAVEEELRRASPALPPSVLAGPWAPFAVAVFP